MVEMFLVIIFLIDFPPLSIIPVNLTLKKLKLFLEYAFLLLVRLFNIGKNINQNTMFQVSIVN